MIKPLLVITGVIWVALAFVDILTASMVASSVFVIGLLVIIAINVQPKREPSGSGYDPDADPDADLFEDFDDPYAEGLTDDAPGEPAARPASAVRVNPRRKARSSV